MKLIKVRVVDVKPPNKSKGFYSAMTEILEDVNDIGLMFIWKKVFALIKKKSEWDDSVVSKFLDSPLGKKLAEQIVSPNKLNYNSPAIDKLIKQFGERFLG